MTLTDPSMEAPFSMRADLVSVPGGIPAPRGVEKTTPVNVVVDRISFAQGELSGSVGRVDVQALRAPEPAKLARLVELSRAIREGKADSEELTSTLTTSWDKFSPFGFMGLQNIIINPGKDEQPVTASSASYALKREGDVWSDSFKCSGLQVKPGLFDGMEEVVKRFAPEGLKLDITSDSRSDSSSVNTESSYSVAGLGKLTTTTALEGEFGKLRKLCLNGDIAELDPFALASDLKVQKIKAHYSDSGLLPLVFSAVAADADMSPAVLTQEASALLAGLPKDGNGTLNKLGAALGQQLLAPGELELEIVPQKAMTVHELTQLLLTNPASIPLKVESRAGAKPMQEYFSGK